MMPLLRPTDLEYPRKTVPTAPVPRDTVPSAPVTGSEVPGAPVLPVVSSAAASPLAGMPSPVIPLHQVHVGLGFVASTLSRPLNSLASEGVTANDLPSPESLVKRMKVSTEQKVANPAQEQQAMDAE